MIPLPSLKKPASTEKPPAEELFIELALSSMLIPYGLVVKGLAENQLFELPSELICWDSMVPSGCS